MRASHVNRGPQHLRRAWEGSGSLECGGTFRKHGPQGCTLPPARLRSSTLKTVKELLEHNKETESSG